MTSEAGDQRVHLISGDVRDHNLGLVLTTLDELGQAARAEIAMDTGLTRAALTGLSAQLLDHGLIRPVLQQRDPRQLGRPIERLELDGQNLAVMGVQLEVDEIRVLAKDLAGRILHSDNQPLRTPLGDPVAVADLIALQVRAAVHRLHQALATPLALEVVVPGLVPRSQPGIVSYALDFGWIDVPFGQLVEQRVPTFPAGLHLAGDAPLAALAEYRALRDKPDLAELTHLLYIKSATGIGAGVIVDGRILQGSRGTIFTPGHIIVEREGQPCACGRKGCLVTVADPELVIANAGLGTLRANEGLPAALDELVKRAKSNDPEVVAAVDEAMDWFRMVVDNAIFMYEPQLVVLGGYLAAFAERIADLPEHTLDRLGCGDHQDREAVIAARLGNIAALQGAIDLRRTSILAAPIRSGILGRTHAAAEQA